MSEVEKMYENAKVKPVCDGLDCFTCTAKCNNGKYPEFTAEKQLELIKWLIKYDELHADFNDNEYGCATINYSGKYKKCFEESLASVINNELWQDLTESEQEQIRSILE